MTDNSLVPMYYDSLVAKVIATGAGREEAIRRMRTALAEYQVGGIKTNIPFHQRILQDPDFLAGNIHTKYLDEFLTAQHDADQDVNQDASPDTAIRQVA